MRKLMTLLVTALLLGASAGFAQDDDAVTTVPVDDVVTENYWGGVSFGYPSISAHFGIKDVLGQGGDVRANLGFGYGYLGGFTLGADALFDIALNVDAPLGLYVGGGPYIGVGVITSFGLQGVAGLEYRLSDMDFNSGAVFLELGPTFGSPFGFNFVGRAGFNYYF